MKKTIIKPKTKKVKKVIKPKVIKSKKPKVEKPKKLFELTLLLNGKEYRGEGETFEAALGQINPKGVRMSGMFKLKHDGKEAKTTLHVKFMRKLFLFRQKIILKFLLHRLMMCLK